jgi:signal transduction histidine kinase
MGPGVNSEIPLYKRKSKVSNYVNDKLKKMDNKEWNKYIEQFLTLDLSTSFTASDQRMPVAPDNEIEDVLKRMGKFKKEDELNCGACGYQTCRAHAIAIIDGLAENEMCLPYTIDRLKDTVSDLENSYSELKDLKEALHHRDKLASMGQLASGVAHEINNPLGVVLMYAYMMLEKLEGQDDSNAQDIKMIVEQAERCKKIVSGLLDFSRQNRVVKNILNIEELVDKCIELSSVPENINVEVISSLKNPEAELDKDQFSQVIINLITNSVDAMSQPDVDHKLTISMEQDGAILLIKFEDTGTGIPEKHIKRIFDPFFTTKEIGKGTGLGLPVSYGIVKMHSGDIRVESNSDPEKGVTGTRVIISIPKYEIKRGGKTYGKDFFSR